MQADFRWDNLQQIKTDKTIAYIKQQTPDKPFFIYYATAAPHQPWIAAPEFKGKSGVNNYADMIVELDYRVGQMVDALKEQGLYENTLIIFTSDNGSSDKHDNPKILREKHGHSVSGKYRGFKKSVWDGGHRLPFIAHWPAGIKPGQQCDETMAIFDLLPTACELAGIEVPDNAGEDSISLVPAFKGQKLSTKRAALVCTAGSGLFSIRRGKWKLCLATEEGHKVKRQVGKLPYQLYDMSKDPGETTNLYEDNRELAEELAKELNQVIIAGRSTPTRDPEFRSQNDSFKGKWKQLNYWRSSTSSLR